MRSSMFESATRCVIVDNMEVSHRRVASSVTNMEAGHRRVAAPVAKHAAASVPRRRARGEGVGGVPLIEASDGGGNRHDKMTMATVYVLQRRHRRQWLQERNK